MRACLADGSVDFERPLLNEALRFRIGREFCYAFQEGGAISAPISLDARGNPKLNPI
jgi:hypothetical protein